MLKTLRNKLAQTLETGARLLETSDNDAEYAESEINASTVNSTRIKGNGRAVFIADGTEQDYIDEIEQAHQSKIAMFLGLK